MTEESPFLTLTNEDYHGDTSRISKSGLDLMGCPLDYYTAYLDPNAPPRKTTKALELGSLAHCALIEEAYLAARYAVLPPSAPARPTSKQLNAKAPSADTVENIEWWRRFNERNQGKYTVSQADYDTARRMADVARKHPVVAALFEFGMAERVVHWTDPLTGVACRLRFDWLSESCNWLTDYKTTEDASPQGFGRSAHKYRYPVQGSYYLDGLWHGAGCHVDGFAFIAQEKSYPYKVAVYYMRQEDFNLGRELYAHDLETYKRCKEDNYWPGYSENIMPLALPGYAFNQRPLKQL